MTDHMSSLPDTSNPDQDPPTPPPLPPLPLSDVKSSKFALKVQAAPPGWFFNGRTSGPPPDLADPPIGLYFIYGTLMDPNMLKDILDLNVLPQMRPANIIGYRLKSWGQYPALVDGEPGEVFSGMVWEVATTNHANRLIEYETRSYIIKSVRIFFTDPNDPDVVINYHNSSEVESEYDRTFMFAGHESELSNKKFDLDVWLKRMGRTSRKTTTVKEDFGKEASTS